jgi:hypothetical protein
MNAIIVYKWLLQLTSTDNTAQIQKALGALTAQVDQSVFLDYPPSKAAILDVIHGTNLVGQGFRDKLSAILSVEGQTTAGIVTGLTQFQVDTDTFRNAAMEAKVSLEKLGLEAYSIPIGEFQVGVLIPGRLIDSKLGALAKELELWNRTLRGFQEVAGEDEREVTVSALASGSYQVYIPLGILSAQLVSRTIDKVFEWYVRILEIRKKRQELQELGAPVAEAEAVRKYERDSLDKEIRALAKELVKDANPKSDQHRRPELETLITVSIKQIARFVDNGGIVEIDSVLPEEGAEPTSPPEGAPPEQNDEYKLMVKEYGRAKLEFERVSRILDEGMRLRQMLERVEPILQLGEGEPEGEPAEIEKSPKKKG